MPNRGHKEGNQIMRAATAALTLALVASAVAPATTRALSAGGFTYILSGANATVTGCTGGTCPADLVIPAAFFVYPVTSIASTAFANNALTTVSIPNSVVSIGDYAFSGNHLTSVTIPNSVLTIGTGAFFNNALTTVSIPNSVTTIGDDAFSYNGALTTVSIPNSVTTIGNYAFQYNALTTVTIPDSVTTIGTAAFSNNALTTVTIGNSVISIGNLAFRDNALTSVTFLGNAPTAGDDVLGGNIGLTSVKRPYTATGWGSTWSDVAVVIADARATATVRPTVAGTATVGRTLTARGTWAGYPTPTLRYQWYVCTRAVTAARTTVPSTCKRITGATRSTYKVTSVQRGKYVAVLVTGTSLRTTATTWLSKTTAKVR